MASVDDARDDDSAVLCNQRTATNTIIIAPITRVARAPMPTTTRSRCRPRSGSARRLSPSGNSGDKPTATGTARTAPTTTAGASTAATAAIRRSAIETQAEEDLFVVAAHRDVPTHRLRGHHEADHADGRGSDQERVALQVTGTFGDAQACTDVADVAALDER